MEITRRSLILATSALLCGCQANSGDTPTPIARRDIDAGSIQAFAADGLYDRFHEQGFFLVRRGDKLSALSSVCTHRSCDLEAGDKGQIILCGCHGSRFELDGRVLTGPATRNLPAFATTVTTTGRLIVHVGTLVAA